jgi:hypothetical protein
MVKLLMVESVSVVRSIAPVPECKLEMLEV